MRPVFAASLIVSAGDPLSMLVLSVSASVSVGSPRWHGCAGRSGSDRSSRPVSISSRVITCAVNRLARYMRTSASVAGYSRRSSASIASKALSWLAVRLVTCAAYCRRSHCPDVTRMHFRDWPTRSVPFRPAGRPRCVSCRVPAACLQEVASGVFRANRRVGEPSSCATAPGGRPNVRQYFRKPPPRVRTPDRR